MRKYLIAVCIMCCCAALVACSDDDKLPNVQPDAQGTFTDERDGNAYGWMRIGDLEWMTSNLKYGDPYYERLFDGVFAGNYGPQTVTSQYGDDDLEADYDKHGNLYTWEEANTLCPDGWRLPTDEDWKNLERALGMSQADANQKGWRGNYFLTLLTQGEDGLGFNMQLSGGAWKTKEGWKYLYLWEVGEFGYFWTATENTDSLLGVQTVWYRKIFGNNESIYRGTQTLDILMRVRCCRDAGK